MPFDKERHRKTLKILVRDGIIKVQNLLGRIFFMVSNYCGKDEGGEVLAMLKVCFEGEAVAEGDKLRLILPEGRSFTVTVSED